MIQKEWWQGLASCWWENCSGILALQHYLMMLEAENRHSIMAQMVEGRHFPVELPKVELDRHMAVEVPLVSLPSHLAESFR